MIESGILKRLCEIPAVSGGEKNITEIIKEIVKDYADEYDIDPLGNILCSKKGKKRAKNTVMLTTSIDEVGMMVSHIEPNGSLRFVTIGDINKKILLGITVEIGEKKIKGVIGSKPIHLLKSGEIENLPEELFIDIGTTTQEKSAEVVSIGDRISFIPYYENSYGVIKGKALSRRVGCVILLNLLKNDLEYDLNFAFTVQGQIGKRGAKTAAYAINPDSAIVVGCTQARDMLGVSHEDKQTELGKGCVTSIMDKNIIYDEKYFSLVNEIAKQKEIPLQIKTAFDDGNESGVIHTSRGGVRTITLCVPCRYMNTTTEFINEKDIGCTFEMLKNISEIIAGEDI